MEKLEIVFKFIRHIAWALVAEGLITIVLGILILAYPSLLIVLVSTILIVTGIISLIVAKKAYSYSKLEIKF